MLNCSEVGLGKIDPDNGLVVANAIVSALISFGGIVGNLLIIASFYAKKSLRNVNNIFLVQLACIDFTKAVFILIPKVYTQLSWQCKISAGYCPISGFISTLSFIHSALLLAAIAVVRYVKMVHTSSFDAVFATRNLICYCLFLAIQTVTLGIVPFLGAAEYKYSPYHGVCFTNWSSKNKGFRITFYVYTIGICYVAILLSYTRIYIKLRAHNSATMASLHSAKSMSPIRCNGDNQEGKDPHVGVEGTYRQREEGNHVENVSNISNQLSDNIEKEMSGASLEEEQDKRNVEVLEDDDSCGNNDSENISTVIDEEVRVDGLNELDIDIKEGLESSMEEDERAKSHNAPKREENPRSSELLTSCLNNALRKIRGRKQGSDKDIRASRLFLSELKVTKIMFLIVVAYTVCWVPAFIINVYMFDQLRENDRENTKEVSPNVLYLIITLVDLKVFVNPVIYGIVNPQFRKGIKSLIRRVMQAQPSLTD